MASAISLTSSVAAMTLGEPAPEQADDSGSEQADCGAQVAARAAAGPPARAAQSLAHRAARRPFPAGQLVGQPQGVAAGSLGKAAPYSSLRLLSSLGLVLARAALVGFAVLGIESL